jgi:hypothetical protein
MADTFCAHCDTLITDRSCVVERGEKTFCCNNCATSRSAASRPSRSSTSRSRRGADREDEPLGQKVKADPTFVDSTFAATYCLQFPCQGPMEQSTTVVRRAVRASERPS